MAWASEHACCWQRRGLGKPALGMGAGPPFSHDMYAGPPAAQASPDKRCHEARAFVRLPRLALTSTVQAMKKLCRGIAVVSTFLVACATTGSGMGASVLRPALDTPNRFGFPGDPSGAGSATACRSPLEDIRDGTHIVMHRSAAGVADYVVPIGRYGVGEGELLRVSCSTGAPIGIVRR